MKALITTIALLCASAAHAEFYTGNDIFNRMTSRDAGDRTFALGFVGGVADLGHGVHHCAPGGVTLGQLYDMVKADMERHPAIRHMSAAMIVTVTLGDTWPCAKKGQL